MKLTKEQLKTLSDCILSEMKRVESLRGSSWVISNEVLNEAQRKLQEINHIICNELERIGNA